MPLQPSAYKPFGGEGITIRLTGFRTVEGRLVRASTRLTAAVRSRIEATTRRMVEALQSRAPRGERRSGGQGRGVRLSESFAPRIRAVPDGLRVQIISTDPLFRVKTEPTRPHTIRARHGGVLHWFDKRGGSLWAKSVQHPGTPGNDFVERTWDDYGREYDAALEQIAREVETLLTRGSGDETQ